MSRRAATWPASIGSWWEGGGEQWTSCWCVEAEGLPAKLR